MNTPEQDWNQEWEDMQPYEICPKCGRHYSELEHEYQYCYQCGWDADLKKFGMPIEPSQSDYDNGDADILTGRWI